MFHGYQTLLWFSLFNTILFLDSFLQTRGQVKSSYGAIEDIVQKITPLLMPWLIHNRAVLHTVPTPGAKIHVDAARPFFDLDLEISRRSLH
jgi:hypothetical protein